MPVLDGEETVKRIRSDLRFKDLYIIVLTAHAEKIISAVSHKHKH